MSKTPGRADPPQRAKHARGARGARTALRQAELPANSREARVTCVERPFPDTS